MLPGTNKGAKGDVLFVEFKDAQALGSLDGLRLAEPGEFTRRAVLNGRLDLTQAEAVADLIEARTLLQAEEAARQLKGTLGRAVKALEDELLSLIGLLEVGIDFVEEDVTIIGSGEAREQLAKILQKTQVLSASFEWGRRVREGVSLAIVGAPRRRASRSGSRSPRATIRAFAATSSVCFVAFLSR